MKIMLEGKKKEQESLVFRIITSYYLWLIVFSVLLFAGIWQCGFALSFMLWYKILDVFVRLSKCVMNIFYKKKDMVDEQGAISERFVKDETF